MLIGKLSIMYCALSSKERDVAKTTWVISFKELLELTIEKDEYNEKYLCFLTKCSNVSPISVLKVPFTTNILEKDFPPLSTELVSNREISFICDMIQKNILEYKNYQLNKKKSKRHRRISSTASNASNYSVTSTVLGQEFEDFVDSSVDRNIGKHVIESHINNSTFAIPSGNMSPGNTSPGGMDSYIPIPLTSRTLSHASATAVMSPHVASLKWKKKGLGVHSRDEVPVSKNCDVEYAKVPPDVTADCVAIAETAFVSLPNHACTTKDVSQLDTYVEHNTAAVARRAMTSGVEDRSNISRHGGAGIDHHHNIANMTCKPFQKPSTTVHKANIGNVADDNRSLGITRSNINSNIVEHGEKSVDVPTAHHHIKPLVREKELIMHVDLSLASPVTTPQYILTPMDNTSKVESIQKGVIENKKCMEDKKIGTFVDVACKTTSDDATTVAIFDDADESSKDTTTSSVVEEKIDSILMAAAVNTSANQSNNSNNMNNSGTLLKYVCGFSFFLGIFSAIGWNYFMPQSVKRDLKNIFQKFY